MVHNIRQDCFSVCRGIKDVTRALLLCLSSAQVWKGMILCHIPEDATSPRLLENLIVTCHNLAFDLGAGPRGVSKFKSVHMIGIVHLANFGAKPNDQENSKTLRSMPKLIDAFHLVDAFVDFDWSLQALSKLGQCNYTHTHQSKTSS